MVSCGTEKESKLSPNGQKIRSITEPVVLGTCTCDCNEYVGVSLLHKHALIAGVTGSGKSNCLHVVITRLAACDDVILWGIDLKGGMALRPWGECFGRLALDPDEATIMLTDAKRILDARAKWLGEKEYSLWNPSPEMPAIVIIIDELAELARQAEAAMFFADSIARLGRAPAVTLIAATQRPTQISTGGADLRSQMATCIVFHMQRKRDSDLIMGEGEANYGWDATRLTKDRYRFLIKSDEHQRPHPCTAFHITDARRKKLSRDYKDSRPQLDKRSRDAISHYTLEIMPGEDTSPIPVVVPKMTPEEKLSAAIVTGKVTSAADLMKATGKKSTWVYTNVKLLPDVTHITGRGWTRDN